MSLKNYLDLPPKERALVAIAVLLDGMEAENYLGDNNHLKAHANWFAGMQPDLRMPYLGSLLRKALSEISRQ